MVHKFQYFENQDVLFINTKNDIIFTMDKRFEYLLLIYTFWVDCGYVRYWEDGKNKSLHRLLMNFPEYPLTVDHINIDPLDNRLCNLRVATKSKQARNTGIRKDNTSGTKGVDLLKISCRARWYNNEGERKSKKFNINKYGFEEAKEKAIKHRKEMEIKFDYN